MDGLASCATHEKARSVLNTHNPNLTCGRSAERLARYSESNGSLRRTGSWRRSDLPAVPPQCIHELRETCRAVGVCVWEIGQLHAMGLSIRPRRDPVLTIRGRYGLVSNLSADTTDREQCRCDDRLSHESGRRLISGLSDQSSSSHTAPPSFTRQTGTSNAAMR